MDFDETYAKWKVWDQIFNIYIIVRKWLEVFSGNMKLCEIIPKHIIRLHSTSAKFNKIAKIVEIREIENFMICFDFYRELKLIWWKKRSVTWSGSVWRSFLKIWNFMKMYLNIVYNLLKSEQNHDFSMFWIWNTFKMLKMIVKIIKMWIS